MSQSRVTLDDTAIRARLRSYQPVSRPAVHYAAPRGQYGVLPQVLKSKPINIAPATPKLVKPVVAPKPLQMQQLINHEPVMDVRRPIKKQLITVAAPLPVVHAKRQQASQVLVRPNSTVQPEVINHSAIQKNRRFGLRFDRTTLLTAMAVVIFLVGTGVSFMSFHTNRIAQAQEEKINKQIDHSATTSPDAGAAAPSTTKPSTQTLANYAVAPDLARYIKIPKLGVNARVLQLGTKSDGSLNAPGNVHDAGWYKDSAKPGAPGATLIDGHVSSWTTNGVFYGIKKLVAGDKITLQKGDGTLLTYSVVKTVTADVDKVDMQSLMIPVTAGKSGLNLITCGGKYDAKSSEFTQRVMVYATLDS